VARRLGETHALGLHVAHVAPEIVGLASSNAAPAPPAGATRTQRLVAEIGVSSSSVKRSARVKKAIASS
jgi:hypothetical protein